MEVAVISVAVVVPIVLMFAVKMQMDINANGGCPECGTPVPGFRRPASVRQALLGGWTCSECGTKMDRSGNEITQV